MIEEEEATAAFIDRRRKSESACMFEINDEGGPNDDGKVKVLLLPLTRMLPLLLFVVVMVDAKEEVEFAPTSTTPPLMPLPRIRNQKKVFYCFISLLTKSRT